MGFVLDASVTLAWSIPDERNERALRLLDDCRRSYAAVPALWPTEVCNGLLIAERKFRIDREETRDLLVNLAALPITIHPPSIEQHEVMNLARDHRLTTYDAAYLQLALELRLDIATFDEALARAATKTGVRVL